MSLLESIGNWLLNSSPGIMQMRGHPEYQDWAAQLAKFASKEELAPLKGVLGKLVSNKLQTVEPLIEFLNREASSVPIKIYWFASEDAIKSESASPAAAFVLALVSMLGWSRAMGKNLDSQINGMPHPGWARIPYACASLALKQGAIQGAQKLVDISYQVLMAAKYQFDPRLQNALADYRRLAREAMRLQEIAVANLADDLYDSCGQKTPNFRAEVGALLWTLGYVPESNSFRITANSSFTPSRRMFRRIVRQSITCIPYDPLTQYIWLELKDRPPFNIREHESLFSIINSCYTQMMLDEFSPVAPSQVFAQCLIAWFKGTLTDKQVDEYLSVVSIINDMFPNMIDWTVYIRMESLGFLIARQFGKVLDTMTAKRELEYWARLSGIGASVCHNRNIFHPEWPELYCSPNIGLFESLEHHLSGGDSGALEKAVMILEEFRNANLEYWLQVIPPFPSADEQVRLGSLMAAEDELCGYLRGAYFVILHSILPAHYRRYGMMMEELIEQQKSETPAFNSEAGRKEYKEIKKELGTLYEKMLPIAPEYAKKRLNLVAGINELVEAIGRHAESPRDRNLQ